MSRDENTLPTTQTILEEMRSGFAAIDGRFSAVEGRLSAIEARLSVIETQQEKMDIRFDRAEGFANQTLSELKYLRADFKEFKSQFKQPA